MPAVKAISFDLWDTVFIDDSDEPKRQQQGLPSKAVERRDLVEQFLVEQAPIDRELVDCAYDTEDAAFRVAWHDQHVTWSVAERLAIVLKGLGRELPEARFAELVRLHEDMELRVKPDLVPGVVEAIEVLRQRYTLVVISDAIFSPGRALRELLESYGLRDAFSGFVFSDEAGCSKPAPGVFEQAIAAAGCAAEELVHLGDREHNDVAGPAAVGARAVLITAAKDRGSAGTQAAAVCHDFKDLPGILEDLG